MKKIKFVPVLSILIVFSVSISTDAFDIWSFLQNEYSAINSGLSDLPSTTDIGDIYDFAYNIAQKKDLSASTESLKSVKDYLNKKYNCSLSAWEINSLYSNSPEGNMFYALAQKRWKASMDDKDKEQWNFASACKKFISCTSWITKDIEYNSESYVECKTKIMQMYSLTKSNIGTSLSLQEWNIWDDMFFNGSLDDSSFDLLSDISEISKILFKNPQYSTESKFNPSTTSSWTWNFKKSWTSSSSNSRLWTGSTNLTWLSVTSTLMEDLLKAQYWNSNWNLVVNPSTYSWNLLGSQTLVNGNLCTSWNLNIYQNISSSISFFDANYASGIYNANAQLLTWTDILSGVLSSWANAYNYSQASSVANDLSNSLLSWQSNSSIQPIAAGQWSNAIKSLTDLFKCTGTADEDWILIIKMCGVKSKKKWISWSFFAKSIEEMIDEMVNLMVNMDQNGALMKHKHTDEFMEVSLQDIKLKDIFAFDVVIWYKPIFEKQETDKDKEQKRANINEKNEQNILNNYQDGSIKAEKNKYLVVRDPVKEEAKAKMTADPSLQNEQLKFVEQFKDQKDPKSQDITSDNQAKLYNEVLWQMRDFVNWNIWAWDVIWEAFGTVRKTSKSLEKKVEAWTN